LNITISKASPYIAVSLASPDFTSNCDRKVEI
jgi:hypothetical protein